MELSKRGYVLNSKLEIETFKYSEYLREFGGDETTTPRGVAPRLYVDGNTVMSWGVRGNNHKVYEYCKNKTEAKEVLYSAWERNVEANWDAPRFFHTKLDLLTDFADSSNRDLKVIKRYFRIKNKLYKNHLIRKREGLLAKLNYDKRPSFSKEEMLTYIKENKVGIELLKSELDNLKANNNHSEWQVKANSLVQRVSNNDFRVLKWKEIYNLIREN